ncbi:hypothetical protein ABE273_22780 [Bacillus paranthracis]|uniref:hypothetical protein n=1 Tax=Bacillus paranthracis TaxID=2026186 RepID=UPI00373358E0
MSSETVRVNSLISKKNDQWLEKMSKETGLSKSSLITIALEVFVDKKMMEQRTISFVKVFPGLFLEFIKKNPEVLKK